MCIPHPEPGEFYFFDKLDWCSYSPVEPIEALLGYRKCRCSATFLRISFDLHKGVPIFDPKASRSDFFTLQALLFPSTVFLSSFHSNSNDKLRIIMNS